MVHVDALQAADDERGRLARSGLGLADVLRVRPSTIV